MLVYMSNFTFLSNRLHLIKNCLFCSVDMHLYSENLSTIAKISHVIILELFPA